MCMPDNAERGFGANACDILRSINTLGDPRMTAIEVFG
ncbi:hypothetical protein BH09PLA1_BH09PLA1_23680 [soil metagenome]